MAEGVDEVMLGWQYEGFVLEEEGQVDQHALQHLPIFVLKTTGTLSLYNTGMLIVHFSIYIYLLKIQSTLL